MNDFFDSVAQMHDAIHITTSGMKAAASRIKHKRCCSSPQNISVAKGGHEESAAEPAPDISSTMDPMRKSQDEQDWDALVREEELGTKSKAVLQRSKSHKSLKVTVTHLRAEIKRKRFLEHLKDEVSRSKQSSEVGQAKQTREPEQAPDQPTGQARTLPTEAADAPRPEPQTLSAEPGADDNSRRSQRLLRQLPLLPPDRPTRSKSAIEADNRDGGGSGGGGGAVGSMFSDLCNADAADSPAAAQRPRIPLRDQGAPGPAADSPGAAADKRPVLEISRRPGVGRSGDVALTLGEGPPASTPPLSNQGAGGGGGGGGGGCGGENQDQDQSDGTSGHSHVVVQ